MDPFWIHFVVSLQRQIKTGMEKELKTNKETSANFIILENEEVTRLAEGKIYWMRYRGIPNVDSNTCEYTASNIEIWENEAIYVNNMLKHTNFRTKTNLLNNDHCYWQCYDFEEFKNSYIADNPYINMSILVSNSLEDLQKARNFIIKKAISHYKWKAELANKHIKDLEAIKWLHD